MEKCSVCGKELCSGNRHYITMNDPFWVVPPFWTCNDCVNSEERLKKYLAQHATMRAAEKEESC